MRDNVGEEVDPEQLIQETCRSCLEQVGASEGLHSPGRAEQPGWDTSLFVALPLAGGTSAALVWLLCLASSSQGLRAGQLMLLLFTAAVGTCHAAGAFCRDQPPWHRSESLGWVWDFFLSPLALVLVAQILSHSDCVFVSRRL